MTTKRQPPGIPVGGQFAATAHAEPELSLSADMTSAAGAARSRRQARLDQMDELAHSIAVDSAITIAAHTRAMFPAAQRVILMAQNFDHSTSEPYEVRDGEDNILVSRMYRTNEDYNAWVGDSDDEGALELLVADVEDHGGRLDGILSERTAAPGRYQTRELDIDKALALGAAAAEAEDNEPPADMGPEEIREWITGQANHHISPVIGWIRRDAARGKDTAAHVNSFHERVDRLANDVAERYSAVPRGLQERTDATHLVRGVMEDRIGKTFMEGATGPAMNARTAAVYWRAASQDAADEIARKVTAPAPVLDGFTAADVEDHLAREQHERQCGCELKGDACATANYGEHWRDRMGVPDVEGIFDSLQEMASARGAAAG